MKDLQLSLTVSVIACLLLTGCEKEDVSTSATEPEKVVEVAQTTGGATNVALNKSYTVSPDPNGFVSTYRQDATDGRKEVSREGAFGFTMRNTTLEVSLDIDLGAKETVSGATLHTWFDKYNEETNSCAYGANYVEVYGSMNGEFTGEETLLGTAGNKMAASDEPGACTLTLECAPQKCRYVRFLITKNFGGPAEKTDWLFIREVEVWAAQ